MAVAMIGPKFYAWDRNGKPLAFGKLFTYQARTNNPKDTYQSEDQIVPNTNPVILNGEGYANVYLSGSYKMVLKDDKDNEIWSSDPVSSAEPSEWVICLTATYVNPTTIKVNGNFAEQYSPGRRVRIDNNAAEYSYSTVKSSSFAANETTIELIDAVITTGVQEICASIIGPNSQQDIGDITDYKFNTVEDLKNGILIGGGEVNLKAGLFVETIGYYAPGDGGGGKYLILAAPAVADEKIDHTVNSGNVAALQYVDAIFVEQAGARKNTDDSSFTEALQAIVDRSGNPASLTDPNTIKARAGLGTFYVKNPIYINALDGFEFEGAGLFNTTIKVSSSFIANSGTVPGDFPNDGLDYSGSALFVIARQRNTGKTNAFIVPGQAPGAGAAWYYKITGFYFDAESTNVEKSIDVIRAPEIANLWMQDIIGHKIRWILHTDDNLGAYSSTFDRIQTWYSFGGLKVKRGTSLLVNQCALIHSDEGWNTITNYSTYNSSTIDLCEGVGGAYAWDIGGIGNTLNACGCEYPKGGIFRALQRGTEITLNGGFFLGGAKQSDPNYTGQTDETGFNVPVGEMIVISGAKVTVNRCMMRNVVEPVLGTTTHLNCTVKDGGRLTMIGNVGEDFNEYVQPHEWIASGQGVGGNKDLSRIDWVGETAQFELFTTADQNIPQNGTPQIEFVNPTVDHDLGPSYFDTFRGVTPRTGSPVTAYTAPMAGIYEFTFEAFIENIDPGDYLFFSITGKPNKLLVLNQFPGTNQGGLVTISDKVILNPNDTVRIFYRSFSGTTDPVMKAGARFFGGICN